MYKQIFLMALSAFISANASAISKAQTDKIELLCKDYRLVQSAGMVIGIQQSDSKALIIACGIAAI